MIKENINQYFKVLFNYKPKPYQLDFASDCVNHNRVVGVFCRQTGKSITTSRTAVLLARLKPNTKIIIFAPSADQYEIMAQYIRDAVKMMPYITKFHVTKINQEKIEFSNGSFIRLLTVNQLGSGETIRGHTANVVIMDEAGSIKDYIYTAVILPMVATTDGKIIKIGTPRGKNHFFEASVSSAYKVHQYSWKEGVKYGVLKYDIVEEARRTTSDIIFRTEWEAEFIEDQDAFFSYELVENCKDNVLDWTNPLKEEGYTYYLGADVARLGQDSTCLMIIKVKNNTAVVSRIIEINKSDLTYVIDKIIELQDFYKFKRMFIDETGLGAGVTDVLAKKYNPAKMQQGKFMVGFGKQTDYSDKVVGVKFTIQSKLDMFSNLKVVMQGGRLKYPNHPKLIAELKDFRYELTENMNVKLHHSDGGHDDFVDALALACKEVNIKSIGYA